MLVLGLLLLVLSVGLVVAVVASGTDEHAMLYGTSISVPTMTVFIAGAATLLVFVLGLLLVRAGMKRANQNRRNNRRLRRLERREAAAPSATPAAPPSAPGSMSSTPPSTPPSTASGGGGGSGTEAAPPSPPASPATGPRGDGPYQQPPPLR